MSNAARVAGALLLGGCIAPGGRPPVDEGAIDACVRAVRAEHGIPGLSVAVVRHGRLVLAKGYGLANVEHGVAASASTVYQSGSVGKQFTAAAVLLLVEDRRLRLDDPIAEHFPAAPESWQRITVRQLLTHTSGLADYSEADLDYRRDYTDAELLAVMQRIPLAAEPGARWSYSNAGYVILGLLIGAVTGAHWSELVAARVLAPAGMETARVISEADIVPHRAAGYVRRDGALQNQSWVSPSINRCADGALYLTVLDLAAWEAALHARRLLAPESYSAWWQPVALADGTTYPYGFGWRLGEQCGSPVIAHGGAWQGFRAAFARYPAHDLAVAVLANIDSADAMSLARQIAALAEPALRAPESATEAGAAAGHGGAR